MHVMKVQFNNLLSIEVSYDFTTLAILVLLWSKPGDFLITRELFMSSLSEGFKYIEVNSDCNGMSKFERKQLINWDQNWENNCRMLHKCLNFFPFSEIFLIVSALVLDVLCNISFMPLHTFLGVEQENFYVYISVLLVKHIFWQAYCINLYKDKRFFYREIYNEDWSV